MPDKTEQAPSSKYDYETIETINQKFINGAVSSLDKINLYGVITFISPIKSGSFVTNSTHTLS